MISVRPLPYKTTAERDEIAKAFAVRWCPLQCGGTLKVKRETYGWGANGMPAVCSKCGLQVRMAWKAAGRALANTGGKA